MKFSDENFLEELLGLLEREAQINEKIAALNPEFAKKYDKFDYFLWRVEAELHMPAFAINREKAKEMALASHKPTDFFTQLIDFAMNYHQIQTKHFMSYK